MKLFTIKRARKVTWATLVSTVLVSMGLVLSESWQQTQFQKIRDFRNELQMDIDELKDLTEIQLNAVGMAVYSGHLSWQNKYYEAEDGIHKTFEKLVQISDPQLQRAAMKFFEEGEILENKQERVFDELLSENQEGARKILQSLDYEIHENKLRKRFADLRDSVEVLRAEQETTLQQIDFWSLVSVVGLVFVEILLTMNALKILSQWNHELEIEVEKTVQKLDEARMQNLSTARLTSLGEMTAVIVHEIGNPLAIISGKAKIWRQKVSEIPNLEKVGFGGPK